MRPFNRFYGMLPSDLIVRFDMYTLYTFMKRSVPASYVAPSEKLMNNLVRQSKELSFPIDGTAIHVVVIGAPMFAS